MRRIEATENLLNYGRLEINKNISPDRILLVLKLGGIPIQPLPSETDSKSSSSSRADHELRICR